MRIRSNLPWLHLFLTHFLLASYETELTTFKTTIMICTEPRHEKTCLQVSDQVRLKPTCSGTEASESHEIAKLETRYIILYRQRTIKALIRLRRCLGWSALLLFACGINRFFHDVAQMQEFLFNILKWKCMYDWCRQKSALRGFKYSYWQARYNYIGSVLFRTSAYQAQTSQKGIILVPGLVAPKPSRTWTSHPIYLSGSSRTTFRVTSFIMGFNSLILFFYVSKFTF